MVLQDLHSQEIVRTFTLRAVSKRREEERPFNQKSAYDTINKGGEMTFKISINSLDI